MVTPPKIAIIARVGAHQDFLRQGLQVKHTESYDTPFGRSNPVHLFLHGDIPFVVLSRHGEAGYHVSAPYVNDRANLYALKALGVAKILAWCAPGAINESMAPGDLVIPHDILDEGHQQPYTFFPNRGLGFVRQNPVFCPELRQSVIQTLKGGSIPVHPSGVYTATTGPRLETPAEIRKYRILGGDLVGMTLVPEVFLARELELCYFEGLATPQEIQRVKEVETAFADIALRLLPGLAETLRHCPCPWLMERYRQRGDIDPDWRSWFV